MITEIILLGVTFAGLFSYSLFMEYVLFGLRKQKRVKPPHPTKPRYLSVIIAYRNESENLSDLIDALRNVDYPDDRYEIIMVDDQSEDNSFDIVEKLKSEKIKNYKIELDDILPPGKKGAIQFGIKQSEGEIILITDADCKIQASWLSEMSKYFTGDTGFVAGPIKIKNGRSFAEKLFGLEQAGLIITSAGLAGGGTPVTCNGANVAYLKTAFEYVNGFSGIDKVLSGDDDLLMQKIRKSEKFKVVYTLNEAASVTVTPAVNKDEFFSQRNRWASKILHYPDSKIILVLALLFLCFISIPALMTASLFKGVYIFPLLFTIAVKASYDYRVLSAGKKIIFEDFSYLIFVIGEILHPFYIIYSVIAGQLKTINWKGREINGVGKK